MEWFMQIRTTNLTYYLLTFAQSLILLVGLSFAVTAQTKSATDGSTPLGLQPGAPAGSYALSGFDNVNLYNGNLSFQLSLLQVSGRGGAQMPVLLPIAGKWRISDLTIPQFNGGVIHHYLPLQSWWENNERKYSPGLVITLLSLEQRSAVSRPQTNEDFFEAKGRIVLFDWRRHGLEDTFEED